MRQDRPFACSKNSFLLKYRTGRDNVLQVTRSIVSTHWERRGYRRERKSERVTERKKVVNFNHAPCSFESICLLFTFWLKRSVSFKTIIPCMWKHQSVRNVINVRSRTTTRMDHINLGMPPTPVSHKALLSS